MGWGSGMGLPGAAREGINGFWRLAASKPLHEMWPVSATAEKLLQTLFMQYDKQIM